MEDVKRDISIKTETEIESEIEPSILPKIEPAELTDTLTESVTPEVQSATQQIAEKEEAGSVGSNSGGEEKESAEKEEDKQEEEKQVEDEDEEDEDEEEEDDIKVTIDDYDIRAAQKQQPQSQQPKQPTIDFEASQTALDVDINTLEDKPWRKPGADLNDYFNYGFDESTWRMYCDRQKKMKAAVNEMVEVQETHRIPVISDFNHKPQHQHAYHQIPVVQPLVVPPSMHVRPPHPHIQRDLRQDVGQDIRMRGMGSNDRMPREHSSHRRSRSPPVHSKSSRGESSRHHSRTKEPKERKRSRSRESSHRRSSGKESRKRRSRSREREDDRHKSKRHKSSRSRV